MVFPFFVKRTFQVDFECPGWPRGSCTVCTGKCGCALRLFSTKREFQIQVSSAETLPIRHLVVETDLVCTGAFWCGQCDDSGVGLGISEFTWNVFYVLYM